MALDDPTPLNLAIRAKDLAAVKAAVASGIDPNGRGQYRTPYIREAAYWGHEPIVKYLIEKGVDVNQAGLSGHTALDAAAQQGYIPVAKLLLDNGANIEAKTNTGDTPLANAVLSKQLKMVEFLIKRGADVNTQTSIGGTPLRTAAVAHDPAMVALLLRNGADMMLQPTYTHNGSVYTVPRAYYGIDDPATLQVFRDYWTYKNKTAPALATLSVASSNPKNNLPEIPHDLLGQVIVPFLSPSGKGTKKLFPTYSAATKSGIVQRAADQEEQEALAAMKTGGRRKTRMRKTKKRRTLRKHKWRTG